MTEFKTGDYVRRSDWPADCGAEVLSIIHQNDLGVCLHLRTSNGAFTSAVFQAANFEKCQTTPTLAASMEMMERPIILAALANSNAAPTLSKQLFAKRAAIIAERAARWAIKELHGDTSAAVSLAKAQRFAQDINAVVSLILRDAVTDPPPDSKTTGAS